MQYLNDLRDMRILLCQWYIASHNEPLGYYKCGKVIVLKNLDGIKHMRDNLKMEIADVVRDEYIRGIERSTKMIKWVFHQSELDEGDVDKFISMCLD